MQEGCLGPLSEHLSMALDRGRRVFTFARHRIESVQGFYRFTRKAVRSREAAATGCCGTTGDKGVGDLAEERPFGRSTGLPCRSSSKIASQLSLRSA